MHFDAFEAEDREVTAYHEAGHAVMYVLVGRQIEHVTIRANNLRQGSCRVVSSGRLRGDREVVGDALVSIAGPLTQEHISGCDDGCDEDYAAVQQHIAWLWSWHRLAHPQSPLADTVRVRAFERLTDFARRRLQYKRIVSAVETLATAIVEQSELSGAAVHALVEPHLRGEPRDLVWKLRVQHLFD